MPTDEPSHSPAAPAPVPLTLRNMRDELYARTATVETRLVALVALPPAEIVRQIAAIRNFRDPLYVPDECLAYFLREWHRTSVADGFGELVGEMERRVERRIRAPFGAYAALAREEAIGRITDRLWRLSFDYTNPRGEYLQVRFGDALKKIIADVRVQLYRLSIQEQDALRDNRRDAGNDGEGYDPLAALADAALPLDERFALTDELRAALSAITDERHREAFVLRYAEQWPVEGDAPPTISGFFGVTSRTIRNWLTTAHEQLARWQEERNAAE